MSRSRDGRPLGGGMSHGDAGNRWSPDHRGNGSGAAQGILDPVRVDPPRENNPDRGDLRAKAETWMRENPDIYGLFLKFARQMLDRRRRFGINLLRERVRWETAFLYEEGTFKINNNLSPYIARRLLMDEPALEGLMRCRRTRW